MILNDKFRRIENKMEILFYIDGHQVNAGNNFI